MSSITVPPASFDAPHLLPVRPAITASIADSATGFLEPYKTGQSTCPPASLLVVQGERHGRLLGVDRGWAHRFRLLSDGRRQILDILLPGDFVGLDWLLDRQSNYSVEAITSLTYSVYSTARLARACDAQPSISLQLLRAAAQDRERSDLHLVSLGPRSPDERVAAFLVDCQQRLQARGLASGDTFALPVAQQHIATMSGSRSCIPIA